MDESRFVVLNLLRHLPPMPSLPQATTRGLRQVDDYLSDREHESALETLAQTIDEYRLSAITSAQAAQRRGHADYRSALAPDVAVYFSDCLTNVLAHCPWAAGQGVRQRRSDPVPAPTTSMAAEPGSVVMVTSDVTDPKRAAVIANLKAAIARAGRSAILVITEERCPREPELRIWSPLTGLTASDRSPEWKASIGSLDGSGQRGAFSADVLTVPRRGDLLAGARFVLRRLRADPVAAAIFIDPLVSPMTAAIAFGALSPCQIALSTDPMPCPLRHIDVVALIDATDSQMSATTELLGRRSARLLDWSSLAGVSAAAAHIVLDELLSGDFGTRADCKTRPATAEA